MNPNALPKIKAQDSPWHQRRGQQDHQRQLGANTSQRHRFVSQEITFHVSSSARPITSSSSLACSLGGLAPSCFPFLLKRSSVILDIVFILRQRERRVSGGGRRVFCLFFLFLSRWHCSGTWEAFFFLFLNNLKPFEICNSHLYHKKYKRS